LLRTARNQRILHMAVGWMNEYHVYIELCKLHKFCLKYFSVFSCLSGPGSSVGIATDYGLDGPGIESQRLRWSSG
jgi:hypothetical protein